jgi:ParB family chromosome partitioning protein
VRDLDVVAAFDERPVTYDPAEIARAGAFVSIDGSGSLRVERGYVRPEDEPPVVVSTADAPDAVEPPPEAPTSDPDDVATPETGSAGPAAPVEAPEEDEGIRPLPDRLLTELTAHRTLALRDALANDPPTAFLAALHVLCLKLFYRYGLDSCLEIDPKSALFSAQAPGLADTASARAIEARHAAWQAQLPKEPGELWTALSGFEADSREALFAHCVALTVNAVHEAYNRRPKAIGHADRVAEAVWLDMAAAGWRPTAESYLGRVTKGRIVAAVREARGEAAAARLASLRKAEMAAAAEALLDGTGWLPEPLRTPGQVFAAVEAAPGGDGPTGGEGTEPTGTGEDPHEAPSPEDALAAE